MTQDTKEFPSQTKNRERWIIDTVRENQKEVQQILLFLNSQFEVEDRLAKFVFDSMQKHDRDTLLLEGGILTPGQIKALTS